MHGYARDEEGGEHYTCRVPREHFFCLQLSHPGNLFWPEPSRTGVSARKTVCGISLTEPRSTLKKSPRDSSTLGKHHSLMKRVENGLKRHCERLGFCFVDAPPRCIMT